MRRFLPILILAIGAGGLVALVNSKPQREALEAREKAWVIDLLVIEPTTVTPHLSLYGRVQSPRTANMSAAVTADVRSVEVLEGQYVTAGQIMVMLDDRELTFYISDPGGAEAVQEIIQISWPPRHRHAGRSYPPTAA